MQQVFEPRRDWYRQPGVRELALRYYRAFRAARWQSPENRSATTRCRECGIFFFVPPSNRGRMDLCCPMGCCAHRRRSRAAARAVAYYQTPEGRIKKEGLNQKRPRKGSVETSAPTSAASEAGQENSISCFLGYLRAILSFLERRRVDCREIRLLVDQILRALRQHSLERGLEIRKVPDD